MDASSPDGTAVACELPVTTSSQAAATSLQLASTRFVQRATDAMSHVDQALTHDPDCVQAHAMKGLLLHGTRNENHREPVAAALQAAEKAADSSDALTHREQLYIDALRHSSAGSLFGAVDCYEQILAQHPHDLYALTQCQSELFWLGEVHRSETVSAQASAGWQPGDSGYADLLAIRAFDLEEVGRYRDAERCGMEALEIDGSTIWAAHAVAHVLYMEDRHRDGAGLLDDWQQRWQQHNQMQFHINWHHRLFLLEQGDHARVLQHYDEGVRNTEHPLVQAMPDLYIDIQNGASMLWRLEQQGVNVGHRWEELAALVEPRLGDIWSPFTSAHFAIVLAAVGNWDACERLLVQMQAFGDEAAAASSTTAAPHIEALPDHGALPARLTRTKTLPARYWRAALPAARAAVLHRRGDAAGAVQELAPARFDLWSMGGSHAQRDVFFQLLARAALDAGDVKLVQTLEPEIEKLGFANIVGRSGYRGVFNGVSG